MDASSNSKLKFSSARDKILAWIQSGQFPSGSRLPSERELANQLSIDHRTVRRGLADLVASGLIVKRPRVGNFVRDIVAPEMLTQVGLVLPDYLLHSEREHPAAALIQKGANRVLDHADHAITSLWYHRDRFWEDVGQKIVARRIRGVLVYMSSSESVALGLKRLVHAGVRVACIDHRPFLEGLDVFSVDIRPTLALRQLVEGLVLRGHRRIAVAYYLPWNLLDDAKKTLSEISAQHGLGDPENMLVPIPSDGYHAKNETLDVLLETSNRPTVIVAPDEFVVSYLFRQCHRRKITVPQDLSIAALLDNAPHSHPIPVTAPEALMLRATEIAAKQLDLMLRGKQCPESYIRLRSRIQWTQSVADLTQAGSQKGNATLPRTTQSEGDVGGVK